MSYPKIRLNFETNVLQDDDLTTDKTTLQISIFGTERNIWKIMQKHSLWVTSCDDTVGTKKIKLYMQIECQLDFLRMLISNGICQYERKYATLITNICHFLGLSPSAFSGKSKAQKHMQINLMLRSGFFRKTRSVTVPRYGFFSRFTDKG